MLESGIGFHINSSALSLSSLELSDTQVYGPSIRALLGTVSHLCEVVVLELTLTLLQMMARLAPEYRLIHVPMELLSSARPDYRLQVSSLSPSGSLSHSLTLSLSLSHSLSLSLSQLISSARPDDR